ncbi:apoptosis-inducing factor 3 isoform X2 [Ailuropoda melanoleuca]|uniref:apoptosis-inducing factor 3 isoform X2 n=1 Tax=Ailuropoda melanoleuca TaxID=9646 RepID=UPI0014940149|nr:apoptosis-inducing factor 3 isoform X2 [Ailuropoda melanoleuca]
MGGCFSKPKPVELKIEVVLPEKERGKEELSGGKGSPRAYQGNGTARHFHAEERLPAPHPYPGAQDCVEAAVCHVKDLENGQMREVELGWGKVLLVKDNGEFHALGHKCPHYGAPLVKGVLSRGRVRCPWHGACFNVSTGDLEDFPGLDSLHKFQVKIEKEKVYVRASKQALQLQRRTKVMAKCISPCAGHSSSTNVLIVGAGAAGLVCAETLRQEGFSDRIVLCTLDRHLPYDRPKLSKCLDAQPEQLALRPKEFFRAYGIEVLTEAQVVTVDVRNKKVVFKDGFKLEYSKLLLAPGSSPKTLSCKGKEVENVFTIRTPEDANRVVRLARGRNAVVVGAGFLGMEVAAYLTEKAHSVSVVELEETPFRRFLGERVGRALMKMFENNRVKFYMQTEVSELRAQEGKLKEVVLKSSKVVRADVCVVGIDDADQRPRSVCSWRCCHLPPGLEEQSESEHPTLADGSCPGPGGGPEHAGAGGGDQHRALPVDSHVRQEPALRGVRRRLRRRHHPGGSGRAQIRGFLHQDRRHVLAHRERILSSHAADLGRHAWAPGTEAKPWRQVPTSNFPGSPRAEPESSQCLPSVAWLTSREASAASKRCLPPKASAATDGWQWRQDRPILFSLSRLVSCRILKHIRYYLKIKTHTFAELCDFHCNWTDTHEGESTTTQCSVSHQFGLCALRGSSN